MYCVSKSPRPPPGGGHIPGRGVAQRPCLRLRLGQFPGPRVPADRAPPSGQPGRPGAAAAGDVLGSCRRCNPSHSCTDKLTSASAAGVALPLPPSLTHSLPCRSLSLRPPVSCLFLQPLAPSLLSHHSCFPFRSSLYRLPICLRRDPPHLLPSSSPSPLAPPPSRLRPPVFPCRHAGSERRPRHRDAGRQQRPGEQRVAVGPGAAVLHNQRPTPRRRPARPGAHPGAHGRRCRAGGGGCSGAAERAGSAGAVRRKRRAGVDERGSADGAERAADPGPADAVLRDGGRDSVRRAVRGVRILPGGVGSARVPRERAAPGRCSGGGGPAPRVPHQRRGLHPGAPRPALRPARSVTMRQSEGQGWPALFFRRTITLHSLAHSLFLSMAHCSTHSLIHTPTRPHALSCPP